MEPSQTVMPEAKIENVTDGSIAKAGLGKNKQSPPEMPFEGQAREPLAVVKTEDNEPKSKKKVTQGKIKKTTTIVHSRLKPTEVSYDSIVSEPVVTAQHTVKEIAFFQYDDLPMNRRGYKYRVCKPNTHFTATKYSTTELPPYEARVSYFDKSQGVACSEDMVKITTQNGWLSARCNVALREGSYYFEYRIVNGNNDRGKAHVRVGVGRKESALDAPVGFDGYGYGLRDLNGQKVTLSRPHEFMNEGFSTGDTIGFLVELPSLEKHKESNQEFVRKFRKAHPKKRARVPSEAEDEERLLNQDGNIFRDQIALKYKNGLFFEQFEYTRTKQMEHLLNPVTVFGETAVLEQNADPQSTIPTIPNSRIVVYKNGACVGEMFNNLYSFLPVELADESAGTDNNTKQQQNVSYRNTDDGSLGYYPMMSVFSNGIVEINAGPDFDFPIPHGAKALSERYGEAIAEEWVWDLIDEVDAQYVDSLE